MSSSPKKSDSARLDELLKLVKSLESKLTQQENNLSKKLDETLESLHNVILENSNLKEKVMVLEKKILNHEHTDFF